MILLAKPSKLDKLFFEFFIELAALRVFVAWTPDSLKQWDYTANGGTAQTQEAGQHGEQTPASQQGAVLMLCNIISISMAPPLGPASSFFLDLPLKGRAAE